MLKLLAACLLIGLLGALEVRLITNDLPYGSGRMEEVNSVKLTINSNGKYIYPHHQNTFKLYYTAYSVRNCQWEGASSKSSQHIMYTPS